MKHPKTDICVTLIGSYTRDVVKLELLFSSLQERFTLLSPVSIAFETNQDGFVKTRSEAACTVKEIESKHLDAVTRSDFVVLHAPDGYVGVSGVVELGYAAALGIPILADTKPTDPVIESLVTGYINDALELKLPSSNPGRGISSLQQYYKRASQRRGWDKESPRDTMLLLVEEIGELARALRKHEGLKRDAGYDGVEVADELADVQLYLVHLANTLDIELSKAVDEKEWKNEARFNQMQGPKT